jgi:3-oxoisoapionate decarboxylase
MRLGVSSYAYSWAVGVPGSPPPQPMSAAALVERAAGLRVRVVQIADNLPLDRLSGAELDELLASARERGVQIEVGTRGIGEAHLCRYLELCTHFGSPILRVVVDAGSDRPSPEEVAVRLRPLLPRFEAAGVCLAVENHDRFLVAALADIVRRLDSPAVGICLDTVNSFGSLEGPRVVVETLGPMTVNLHVKDFRIRRVESQMGFRIDGCPAGEGQLDTPWLLAELRRHGRDPNAILELWTPPEPALAATIEKESVWAEASIAYLRRLIPD